MDGSRQAPLSMGILQAKRLEWVAMPSSRGSSQTKGQMQISYIAGKPPGKSPVVNKELFTSEYRNA